MRFLWTLWRYSLLRAKSALQWTFRSRRNLAIVFGSLAVLTLIWVSAKGVVLTERVPAEAAPSSAPTETLTYRTATAEPVDGNSDTTTGSASPAPSDSASTEPRGPSAEDGPQAVETGTQPSYEKQDITQPKKPIPNRDKAVSTAKAWLTAYHARPSAEDETWSAWIKPYTSDELHKQLTGPETPYQAMKGKEPTAVRDITISNQAPKDTPRDTPIRWTRTAEVQVAAEEGTVTTITYTVTLADTDKGWTVTDAAPEVWEVKHAAS
jgi:hypothetical protein